MSFVINSWLINKAFNREHNGQTGGWSPSQTYWMELIVARWGHPVRQRATGERGRGMWQETIGDEGWRGAGMQRRAEGIKEGIMEDRTGDKKTAKSTMFKELHTRLLNHWSWSEPVIDRWVIDVSFFLGNFFKLKFAAFLYHYMTNWAIGKKAFLWFSFSHRMID